MLIVECNDCMIRAMKVFMEKELIKAIAKMFSLRMARFPQLDSLIFIYAYLEHHAKDYHDFRTPGSGGEERLMASVKNM